MPGRSAARWLLAALSAVLLFFPPPCRGEAWEQRFRALPSTWGAYEHLAYYTAQPHVAGTPEDYATAVHTATQLRKYGFEADLWPFEALMSYPVHASLRLLSPQQFQATLREAVLPEDPTSGDPRSFTPLPYNCFSASGNATGELVYANYGRLEDFQWLDHRNVSVKGRIVIVRYGAVFRGLKVWQAQVRGAAGVLIYSDPADDGFGRGPTYPAGPWRPPSSVQRGSVQFSSICNGSPDPSRFEVCGVARQSELIPAIPVQPISYGDAEPFLRALQGTTPAPAEWQGGLNFTYNIGPGSAVVELAVQHDTRMRKMWNVVGTLKGAAEPDRWVILGNHRDAWTFGAADPNSGSATLLEVARGLGQLVQEGWRPRRTVVLCSWDGEEAGLLGSVAWVEANAAALTAKAVAYLNVDVAVSGPYFKIEAIPTLEGLIREVAGATILPNGEPVLKKHEEVGPLGGGSDYTGFVNFLGIASLDMGFSQTPEHSYATYHSNFDSIAWMNRFGDPTYEHFVAAAQVWGVLALRLADSPALPYNYTAYAAALRRHCAKIDALVHAQPWPLDTQPLRDAVEDLAAAARGIEREGQALQAAAPAQPAGRELYRSLNDRLVQAERRFLAAGGLPGRKWFKHLVYAQGLYLGYGADVFPGLAEAVRSQGPAVARPQAPPSAVAVRRKAGGTGLGGVPPVQTPQPPQNGQFFPSGTLRQFLLSF